MISLIYRQNSSILYTLTFSIIFLGCGKNEAIQSTPCERFACWDSQNDALYPKYVGPEWIQVGNYNSFAISSDGNNDRYAIGNRIVPRASIIVCPGPVPVFRDVSTATIHLATATNTNKILTHYADSSACRSDCAIILQPIQDTITITDSLLQTFTRIQNVPDTERNLECETRIYFEILD